LRDQALRVLVRHMAPRGHIVFNNHLNNSSAFLRLAHAVGKARHLGMSHGEVKDMTTRAGLEIIDVYHLGILPSNDRYLLLPLSVVRRVERWAAGMEMFRRWSQNLIYVCRQMS